MPWWHLFDATFSDGSWSLPLVRPAAPWCSLATRGALLDRGLVFCLQLVIESTATALFFFRLAVRSFRDLLLALFRTLELNSAGMINLYESSMPSIASSCALSTL